MKRMLKHNQLKPLNLNSEQNETNSNSNLSQVQLAPLNKESLKKHNQNLKGGQYEENENEKTFVTNNNHH